MRIFGQEVLLEGREKLFLVPGSRTLDERDKHREVVLRKIKGGIPLNIKEIGHLVPFGTMLFISVQWMVIYWATSVQDILVQ